MAESWRHALGSRRLLVSGFGKWGGGLYDLTSGRPVALDNLPTSGVAVGGGRFWRVLRAPGEQTACGELLSYDERGVLSYLRLDAIRDPHDVAFHDGAVHITSSWDSTVWRLDADGTPRPMWQGGPVPDSWHPNSLVVVDGRLHVCAFGRFDVHKGWKKDEKAKTGFVHDLVRGVDVLTGLGHPHTPRYVDGRWYVCESTGGALVELDEAGRELRRVSVRRFSRGLAIVGVWALVGGNAHRKDEDDRASIAVVDRRSFEVVEHIPMPCLEVYDIVPVPVRLARGVAMGFGSNAARSVEQHRGQGRVVERRPTSDDAALQLVTPRVAAKLAAPGQIVESDVAARCRVDAADLPAAIGAGETRVLTVRVQNRSGRALATVVPQPIRVGARWLPLDNGHQTDVEQAVTNPLAPLPRLLHPGDQAEMEIVLAAPDRPGRYQVRVAFNQSGLGWFGRRLQAEVTVVAASPAEIDAGEPQKPALLQRSGD